MFMRSLDNAHKIIFQNVLSSIFGILVFKRKCEMAKSANWNELLKKTDAH